jgi:hypothetical protein
MKVEEKKRTRYTDLWKVCVNGFKVGEACGRVQFIKHACAFEGVIVDSTKMSLLNGRMWAQHNALIVVVFCICGTERTERGK